MPVFGFSQNVYTFGNGGKVLENGIKISPEKVREIFTNSQQVTDLYDAGRTKKTVGNILLWDGFALLIGKFYNDSSVYSYLGPDKYSIIIVEKSRYPYAIAGAMIIAAIPIKIGFSNKIKQAVALMNQDFKNPKTAFIESSDIIVNSNGIGISLKF